MTELHRYKKHRFGPKALLWIEKINAIIEDMVIRQGYAIGLRTIYYKLVGAGVIPNDDKAYKELIRIVTNGREHGLIRWDAIFDNERHVWMPAVRETPMSALAGIERRLQLDMWARQPTYIEVTVEKKALEAVVRRPCAKRGVTHMACKGYLSATEAELMGQRFADAVEAGKFCTLIHLADHDPSGEDMTDDLQKRVSRYCETSIPIRRIALNLDQVKEHDLVPNPAKKTDARFKKYQRKHGVDDSWELDALDASVVDRLITEEIELHIDEDIWTETLEEQHEARKPLVALSKNWSDVLTFMRGTDMME